MSRDVGSAPAADATLTTEADAMMSTTLKIVRRGLLMLSAIAALTSTPNDLASPPADDSVATIHEARLRKLHLVRPDLINYPIASDVLC